MTAQPPPGRRLRSRAAAELVYTELAGDVTAVASWFARTRDIDADECVSEANVAFLEAYHTHDGRTPIRKRVNHRVYHHLLDRSRRWARRDARHREQSLPPRLPAPAAPETPFDRDGLLSRLGADAATVVRLLLETPSELADAIRGDRNPGPASIKSCLRAYLLENLTWGASRVVAAFREVGEALKS